MPSPFRPLENIKRIVDGAKADLRHLRDIDAKLRASIATQASREQYTEQYRQREIGKLREHAIGVAQGYLASEDTLSLLASVKDQRDRWTVAGYLARAANDTNTNDVATLLKKNNLLLTLPRMTTVALADLAQELVDRADWPNVGVILNEAAHRRQTGDDAALALEAGILSVQIPALDEAKKLMIEAHRLEEWIGYTKRAIETGAEDVGVKHETWAAQWAAKQAEQQQTDLKPAA